MQGWVFQPRISRDGRNTLTLGCWELLQTRLLARQLTRVSVFAILHVEKCSPCQRVMTRRMLFGGQTRDSASPLPL